MGGEWQQLLQSVLIGLIFAYLLAKLIAIITSFKENNLAIIRNIDSFETEQEGGPDGARNGYHSVPEDSPELNERDSVIAEIGSVRNENLIGTDEDDDDWEGVESTELDEMFSAATAFVAATAADRLAQQKLPNDVQLQLYGLYKIAIEGPCSTPQPSALKMTARSKWQAWQKLGAMPPEEAMEKYIDIVTEIFPSSPSGLNAKSRGGDDTKGPMGPVFSTYVYEEESGNELKMDAIHAFAREGDLSNLLKCIQNGVSVNVKDSEGRTPLHWAVDRGHLNIAEQLSSSNANINAKDNEGQTPLHYAVVCERKDIAEFLIKHNANTNLKDNDGDSPIDLCKSRWPWMQSSENAE